MSERFATTQWSVVLAARDGTEGEARQALESLCDAYWYPLYAYVRRRGHDAEEARDLTQALFADLLGRDFLERRRPLEGPVPLVPARLARELPLARSATRRTR